MPDKPVIDIEGLINSTDQKLTIINNKDAKAEWDYFKSNFVYHKEVNEYLVDGHKPKAIVVHRGISAPPNLAVYRQFFSDIDAIRMVYMEKTKYKDNEVYCCIICCYVGTSEQLCEKLLENEQTASIFWILVETCYDIRSLIKEK
jgi:hypothetical protein